MPSPPSTPSTPSSAPKAMSSRLLTMKFMQRAAASTPSPSSPTPDEPSPKRLKKNSDWVVPELNGNSLANQQAVQAALDAEEAKRQAALDKQAAEAGDTRWVLSFEDLEKSAQAATGGLRIIRAGYASLDVPPSQQIRRMDDDEFGDRPVMIGRRSFAKFNKALEREQGTLEESSESESESESSSSEAEELSEPNNAEDDDPIQQLARAVRLEAAQKMKAERQAKRKAEKAQMQEFSKKRKKKEVKLNTNMTSLTGRQDRVDTRTCFVCGGPHLKIDCPRNQNGAQKRFYQGGDDGPRAKSRKVK